MSTKKSAPSPLLFRCSGIPGYKNSIIELPVIFHRRAKKYYELARFDCSKISQYSTRYHFDMYNNHTGKCEEETSIFSEKTAIAENTGDECVSVPNIQCHFESFNSAL